MYNINLEILGVFDILVTSYIYSLTMTDSNESSLRVAESIYDNELHKLIEGLLVLKKEFVKRGDLETLETLEWIKGVAIDGVVARDIRRRKSIV